MEVSAHQKFRFRKDSHFSVEQSLFIILNYGELKCTAAVKRSFGTNIYRKNPRKILNHKAFQRVIDRFLASASVRTAVPPSLPPLRGVCSADEGLFSSKPRSTHQGGGGSARDKLWPNLDHPEKRVDV